jgi:hypothetical protein
VPRRFSASTAAYAAIIVVVLAVVAVVIVAVTGGKPNTTSGAPARTPAPASLVSEITGVPASVEQAVGVPSSVQAPSLYKGQPALTGANGKPEALFIGAEFCPLCAAERWAIIMAFSRFGTFSGLEETTSSPWDSPPAVATFTFRTATYSSSYLDFAMVEHQTNDTNGLGTRTNLEPLTDQESTLWSKYESHFGEQEGYPFIDMGNKVFVYYPSYNPTVLEGLNQSAIAAKLTNPNDPVTQAIVGTANYLTAGICSITNDQPGSVCSAAAVTEAAKAIGLS